MELFELRARRLGIFFLRYRVFHPYLYVQRSSPAIQALFAITRPVAPPKELPPWKRRRAAAIVAAKRAAAAAARAPVKHVYPKRSMVPPRRPDVTGPVPAPEAVRPPTPAEALELPLLGGRLSQLPRR